MLAGKVAEPGEYRYLEEVIRPMAGPDVELVINADRQRSDRLLANARRPIFPIRWQEPFGMVLIEAMAVGTGGGVEPGGRPRGGDPRRVTGFIREDPDDLPEARTGCPNWDPAGLRRSRPHVVLGRPDGPAVRGRLRAAARTSRPERGEDLASPAWR